MTGLGLRRWRGERGWGQQMETITIGGFLPSGRSRQAKELPTSFQQGDVRWNHFNFREMWSGQSGIGRHQVDNQSSRTQTIATGVVKLQVKDITTIRLIAHPDP